MEKNSPIGFTLKNLSNHFKRFADYKMQSLRLEEETGVQVTGIQGWIIGYLSRCPGDKEIFQRDLEAEFQVRRSTITGILQLMEKNGVITRVSVAQDARLKKIVLTEKGIEVHKKIVMCLESVEAEARGGITDEELALFLNVAEKIKKNIEI